MDWSQIKLFFCDASYLNQNEHETRNSNSRVGHTSLSVVVLTILKFIPTLKFSHFAFDTQSLLKKPDKWVIVHGYRYLPTYKPGLVKNVKNSILGIYCSAT